MLARAWMVAGLVGLATAAGCGSGSESTGGAGGGGTGAKEVASFECTETGETFTYQLPDSDPTTVANYVVVQTVGAPGAPCDIRTIWTPATVIDDKITIACPALCPGKTAMLTVVER